MDNELTDIVYGKGERGARSAPTNIAHRETVGTMMILTPTSSL